MDLVEEPDRVGDVVHLPVSHPVSGGSGLRARLDAAPQDAIKLGLTGIGELDGAQGLALCPVGFEDHADQPDQGLHQGDPRLVGAAGDARNGGLDDACGTAEWPVVGIPYPTSAVLGGAGQGVDGSSERARPVDLDPAPQHRVDAGGLTRRSRPHDRVGGRRLFEPVSEHVDPVDGVRPRAQVPGRELPRRSRSEGRGLPRLDRAGRVAPLPARPQPGQREVRGELPPAEPDRLPALERREGDRVATAGASRGQKREVEDALGEAAVAGPVAVGQALVHG